MSTETLPASAGKITRLADVRAYLLAGAARFTLASTATGDRKTFRVKSNGDGAWFVELLVGPDNTADYKYLAFLYPDVRDPSPAKLLKLKPNKDHWGEDAYRAFDWLVRRLNVVRDVRPESVSPEDELFNRQAEFYHLGTCARCGRDLTTPESVARGLGPTCAGEV